VAIFDSTVFEAIFSEMVAKDAEGTILAGPSGKGIAFTNKNVDLYADHPDTTNTGASCLRLTWRHRAFLGL
jgi:hypothetical protein